MTVFHSGDMHLDHDAIISLSNRPFQNVNTMNAALIRNINDVCGPEDTLVLHGDIGMSVREQSLSWLRHVKCHLILGPPGNHDHVWSGSRKNQDVYGPLYGQYMYVVNEPFQGAGLQHTMEDGTHVLLSHFPYEGDHTTEDRYKEWRPVDNGLVLLHGHVHDAWKVKRSSKGTLMVNVGVDVWDYTPVSENTLADLINKEQA